MLNSSKESNPPSLAQTLLSPNLGLIMLVGVLGGLAGLLYLSILWRLQEYIWPSDSMSIKQGILLIGVGIWTAVCTRILGDPGDVDLLVDNIHVLGGAKDTRALRSLLPISLVNIAVGGAAGPEAPLVQTTGSLGTWIAARQKLNQSDRRVLTITGMAAGFTVLFGAPLGAAIFALEILHRRGLEYYEALLPAIVGSLCGFVVFAITTGLGMTPAWEFPALGSLQGDDFIWSGIVGITAACVAITFIKLTGIAKLAFKLIPRGMQPILGGIVLALLAYLSPYTLTFGEHQLGQLIQINPTWSILVFAILGKMLGTIVTICSGWRGGFIIPVFFIGAALGRLLHIYVPSTNELILMAAFMAAINTGITKTPIGSTLVVAEMAGIRLLPTTMLASVITLLLTYKSGILSSQRPRKDNSESI